jgi:hypothetical protein
MYLSLQPVRLGALPIPEPLPQSRPAQSQGLRGATRPLGYRLLNRSPQVGHFHVALDDNLFNIVTFEYVSPHRTGWRASRDKYAACARVPNPHQVKQFATLAVTICFQIKIDQRNVVRGSRLQQLNCSLHRFSRIYMMVAKPSLDESAP